MLLLFYINYHYIGYTDQPEKLFSMADVFCLPSHREGFHVIEQTGMAIIEYWMPKTIFDPNHIRTKTYTIGEVMIMILQGQLFRRASWPINRFLQYRESVDLDNDLKEFVPTKENPACAKMESFITIATIHADPLKKGKFDVHVEPWVPTQDDLFARDFQSFRIDLNNVAGKKKK